MPSRARSPPLAVTVLAALWVSLGLSGAAESPGPGCDNGKLYLDRDLPADAVYWRYSVPTWTESTQRLPSIDTVYDPEPARELCMDKHISYNHTIPNSGGFRPVMAESGEYVYCPPQRWLNNLHHGATVFLHHPCAPLHEVRLLSGLARSCLPDYIITPHPQLSTHMPIALVSWGRTLELTAVASADICDWLQTRQTTRHRLDSVTKTRKYNLLLTRSAGPHRLERLTEMKDSLRRCCERTISSLLRGTSEAQSTKEEHLMLNTEGGKGREIRAAVGEEELNRKKHGTVRNDSSFSSSQTNRTILQRTAAVQNYSRTLSPSADSFLGKRSVTSRPTVMAVTSKAEGTDSVKRKEKSSIQRSMKEKNFKNLTVHHRTKDNEVVDVEERELAQNQKLSDAHTPQKSDNAEFGSAPGSHSESRSQAQSGADGEHCGGCTEAPAVENRAAVVNAGLQRTPRTDEAVWAAAALGFLLVLLTLSVLHTRLYRHWRTTPSLYWHDPQRDYDSVADVIRRRLRIAKRRRKRSRRQECVFLPSSSSSDEQS